VFFAILSNCSIILKIKELKAVKNLKKIEFGPFRRPQYGQKMIRPASQFIKGYAIPSFKDRLLHVPQITPFAFNRHSRTDNDGQADPKRRIMAYIKTRPKKCFELMR
jgi:hypothetical protein